MISSETIIFLFPQNISAVAHAVLISMQINETIEEVYDIRNNERNKGTKFPFYVHFIARRRRISEVSLILHTHSMRGFVSLVTCSSQDANDSIIL